MHEPPDSDPSLLQEYRSEFTQRFRALQLWNDRRRILAEPAVAAQVSPPLANSPVRFALSLQLVPVLFIGWLVSALVGLVVSDDERVDAYASKLNPAIELLDERLGHRSKQEVDDLAREAGVQHMHPQANALWMELVKAIAFHATNDSTRVRDGVAAWLQHLEASPLSAEHRLVLEAKALRFIRGQGESEKFRDTIMRSVTEGGVAMQLISVFSLLFSAWLLGQTLRGDPRFVLAARADRFYLYYSTSLVFWFLVAKVLCFGVTSFAYASGKPALFVGSQSVQMLVGLAAAVWLVSRSGEMARVLCDANPAPKGATFAIAWRIVVTMLVSLIVVLAICLFIGLAIGIVVGMMRG